MAIVKNSELASYGYSGPMGNVSRSAGDNYVLQRTSGSGFGDASVAALAQQNARLESENRQLRQQVTKLQQQLIALSANRPTTGSYGVAPASLSKAQRMTRPMPADQSALVVKNTYAPPLSPSEQPPPAGEGVVELSPGEEEEGVGSESDLGDLDGFEDLDADLGLD